MRGTRVKKLRAIYSELVKRGQAPSENMKRHFRFFKRLYKQGELRKFLPSM